MILTSHFHGPKFVNPYFSMWPGTCDIKKQGIRFGPWTNGICGNETDMALGISHLGLYKETYVCEDCMQTYWGTTVLEYLYKSEVVFAKKRSVLNIDRKYILPCLHEPLAECAQEGCKEFRSGHVIDIHEELCLEHAFQWMLKHADPFDIERPLGVLYQKFPYLQPQTKPEFPPTPPEFPHSHYTQNDFNEAVERVGRACLDAHPEWRELTELGRRSRFSDLSITELQRAEELRGKFVAAGLIEV